MIQGIAKVLWLLLSGAFIFGAWASTLEIRVRNNSEDLAAVKTETREMKDKYLDVLGRIDERLKNIEKQTK